MPYCSVLECKNDSRTKNRLRGGVSYHRFPKSAYSKNKWIEATGRLNWMPAKSSCICSEHFEDKSFLISNKGYRYLNDHAVPTKKIMTYGTQCPQDLSGCNTIEKRAGSSSKILNKNAQNLAKDLETKQKDYSSVHLKEQSSIEIQESNAQDDIMQINVQSCSSKQVITEGLFETPSKKAQKDSGVILAVKQPSFADCKEKDLTYNADLRDVKSCTPCSSLYSTPKKKKLSSMLRRSRSIIIKKNIKIKRLQTQNRRLKRKIESIQQLLKDLEEKFAMSNENLTCLKNTNVEVNDLISRQVQKGKSGVTSKKKYSPALRCFALTLHFYSPKAYDYVRKVFNVCLPDARTLRRWYSKVGGEPGFTQESFTALKFKAQSSNQLIAGALVIDEMSIRQRIEWDGQKLHGYVDMGTGLEGDHLAEAKEALVFLVTAINSNFKVPIGFFLVDGVTGLQRAELVKQAMELIHETGVLIVALTFDGCAANISMAGHLGCDFQNGNVKFPHPVTNDSVVAILDPCHMIKLLRNAFETYKIFIDKDGKMIEWKYLTQLNAQQRDETFHLSNKLRDRHINFKNERMKVKLATQLFSMSVAKALEFCRATLHMFRNSEATENFLIICNNIFDIFNSRNLYFYGFKKALNVNNATQIFQYLDMAADYISKLKTENGTLLIKSPRKTGFVGFLGCIEALKHLYTSLIESKILLYLPFYKLSQDHLELLFCNIRSHGGANNNPTARQFIAAYKKILVHVELKNTDKGNCTALEQISILTCSSAVERINISTHQHQDITHNFQNDEMDIFLEFQEIGESLSEFGNQAVGHIAGYIVRSLIKKIKCDVCVSGLVTTEICSFHKFIVATNRGGLLYPSADVFKICKTTELSLKVCPASMMKKEIILNKVMRQFVGSDLFSNISYHQLGQFPVSNHITDLIKSVVERYVNVRLHHLMKLSLKLSKRQLLNKYVLFQGQ